jgi:Penicillin amidase
VKRPTLILTLLCVSCTAPPASKTSPSKQLTTWQAQAQNVLITRDDWGIPHIHGKTDADAVFGLIYAQAEDDFNRVENNFLISQGRSAEADGEAEIWRDLRMKLFIDPEDMKAKYLASPDWLKKLMNAWADGLNYYLYTHPHVIPRVIAHLARDTESSSGIGGAFKGGSTTRRPRARRNLLSATPRWVHGQHAAKTCRIQDRRRQGSGKVRRPRRLPPPCMWA